MTQPDQPEPTFEMAESLRRDGFGDDEITDMFTTTEETR